MRYMEGALYSHSYFSYMSSRKRWAALPLISVTPLHVVRPSLFVQKKWCSRDVDVFYSVVDSFGAFGHPELNDVSSLRGK